MLKDVPSSRLDVELCRWHHFWHDGQHLLPQWSCQPRARGAGSCGRVRFTACKPPNRRSQFVPMRSGASTPCTLRCPASATVRDQSHKAASAGSFDGLTADVSSKLTSAHHELPLASTRCEDFRLAIVRSTSV